MNRFRWLLLSFVLTSTLHAEAEPAVLELSLTAECLPHSYLSKNWPVAAIYMHGLLEWETHLYTYRRSSELSNRQSLEQLALEKRIRIAVPLSIKKRGQWLIWNDVSLNEIETLAQAACGGEPLAEGRDLIAFSNGGIRSQKLTCGETESYSHVFSVGLTEFANGEGTKTCGATNPRFQQLIEHDFEAGLKKFAPLIRANQEIKLPLKPHPSHAK